IGVAFIAGVIQNATGAGQAIAAGGIVAQVVPLRSNGAAVVHNVAPARPAHENGIVELEDRSATRAGDVNTAPIITGGVLAEGAIADAQRSATAFAIDVHATTMLAGGILTEGAIDNVARRAAHETIVVNGAGADAPRVLTKG